MSRASERLLDRSVRYLMDARFMVGQPVGESDEVNEDVGRILLREINAVLKIALQTRDLETFREMERRWQEIPEEGDIWGQAQDSPVSRLVAYRRILTFGLAMWSTHLLKSQEEIENLIPGDVRVEALRLLAGRFEGVEDVFGVYEQASERDDEDRVPWSNWFLSELAAEEVHAIPTSEELLFTALLLALVWTSPDQPTEVEPRDWMRWRDEDIDRMLTQLAEEGPRWGSILGLTATESKILPEVGVELRDWQGRVSHLRELIGEGKRKQEEQRRQGVREAPLDAKKVSDLELGLRRSLVRKRVIRHLFAAQGGLQKVPALPDDHIELSSRHWIPKSLLIADSNVLGLDTVAHQLSLPALNGEVERLLRVLPSGDARKVDREDELAGALAQEFERMREADRAPTLLLAPVSWRLRQALGLAPIGTDPSLAAHPLVPAAIAQHFAGSFEGVPVLDAPQVPAGQLWALDLSRVATFLEWPSEEDSGVRLEVEVFSASETEQLLKDEPNIVGDQDPAEVAVRLQESALLTQHICWLIEPGDEAAAIAFDIPDALVFKP